MKPAGSHRIALRFRAKIFILFFLFTLCIGAGIGLLLYRTSAELLIAQMCDAMDNNLQNASYNLDSILSSVNRAVTELSLEADIVRALQEAPDWESYDYLVLAGRMRDTLNRIRNGSAVLQSVYLVSADFRYFYKSQIDRTFYRDELLTTDWAALYPESRENVWYVLSGGNTVVERVPCDTLTSVKQIRDLGRNKTIGYAAANVSFAKLRDYFGRIRFGQTGYMVVYNGEGQIVFHPDAGRNGQTENEIFPLLDRSRGQDSLLRDDALITYHASAESGLIYAAYIPMQEVVAPTVAVRNMTLLLLAVCVGIALLYAIFISRQIFAPIGILVRHMKRAGEGDTSVRIAESRRDEMGVLYDGFNAMISRIETLIRRVYEQEVLAKELKIENLQIQLNPHFLYNTLDSIHWAARENDMDDVCRMTFLLSRFFHASLSDGRDFLTVREAAAITESYIELQKMRSLDKIHDRLSIDPRIAESRVLKYLFQPLVENALVHGIEQKNGPGFCRVSWTKEENEIRFCVEDDGPGIPGDKLLALRSAIEKDNLEIAEHFALRNINLQLRLYYGPQYRLHVESVYGQGTRVWFRMPIREEGEDV